MMKPNMLRIVYDFFIKHWFISTLIFTLSSNWFVLLTFYGKEYGLIDKSGIISGVGSLITVGFVVVSVIFALLKTLGDRHNELAKNNGQYLLESMIVSMDAATIPKAF